MGDKLGSEELRVKVKEFADWDEDFKVRIMSILEYLETHYTSDAFVEVGKRGDR